MAAVVGTVAEDIFALLESGGVTGIAARGVAGGLIGLGVADLIKFLEGNKGTPAGNNARAKVPQFALVDLHNNTTVRFLSRRATYRLLTTRRKRIGARRPRVAVVPQGSELVAIR